MGKGEHLSRYQHGIVRRHYEHFDTKVATRLQELLTELFLATAGPDGPSKAKTLDGLWRKAEENLAKAKVEPAAITRAVGERKVERLAELVNQVTAPRK